MIRRMFLSLLLLIPLVANAQLKPGIPVAGKDYIVLTAAQPKWGVGNLEIVEVFSYSCSHCAEFQPMVNDWKKTLPKDVNFRYVPAVFGGFWDATARAYFAAEALGVQAKTHDAIFKAIFIDKKIKRGTVEELADVYASLGVDRAKILSAMNGTTVSAKLNRSKLFTQRTGVDRTPTLIVNGKYRVIGRSNAESLKIAEFLIAKERAALPKPAAAK
jgi:thiol:disulfide interchange protein DsbA